MNPDPDISMLLGRDIESAWSNCLEIWRKDGRVEDLPRGVRLMRYMPRFGRILAARFAEKFQSEYDFVVRRLKSPDNIEVLCAFEVLELMMKYFINLPLSIRDIRNQIPEPVASELKYERVYANFTGSTIGELLAFDFDGDGFR